MVYKKILLDGDVTGATMSDSVPLACSVGTGTAGTSVNSTRGDHRHRVAVGSAASMPSMTTGAARNAGSSGKLARIDHVHATPATWAPSDHASAHKSGGGDVIRLNSLASANSAVSLWNKQLNKHKLEALATAPSAVTGRIYWRTADSHPYVYVP